MRRPGDWFRQAQLDLAAASDAEGQGHYEWACFAAQQAAEKAVKAVHESMGTEAWRQSVTALLGALDQIPREVLDAAKALDKHYIPTRYPNSHPAGAPGDLYTASEAERALADAQRIIGHVQSRLPSA
jgi:HEPN domain-containing protein